MEQLIPIVNKLQDVFTAMGVQALQLPQLVVVGSQSSGKSSVLENIVGRDFLPRGSNIVTRRPLILQLVNTTRLTEEEAKGNSESKSPGSPNPGSSAAGTAASLGLNGQSEWAEFLHRKGEIFLDFERVRDEITRETERIVGKNKGVSNKPISLKIFSPHVLHLTLVDLPGITKVPVGDQPSDIEAQIREMILEHISNPQAIVVAVSPANADIANSDALKLAREVDPHGLRTLGVITKIDLMDKGTDAMDVLIGKVVPLQHGFVGVVNRSQLDINQKKSIHTALKAEKGFFQNHSVYRPIASRMGTPYLTKRLNAILLNHIQDCLPELRLKIGTTIAETQAELESYGNPLLHNSTNLGPLLLHLLSKFCNNFRDALDGKSPDVSITELYGGARISYVFHDIFGSGLDNINPFDTLTDHDIRTAIRNATGPRPSLFIPEVSFELLVKRQIERLLSPALQCVDMVFDELKRVASQCEQLSTELLRFPILREKMLACVRDLLVRRVAPTKEMITGLINIELSYINTNHPDFVGGTKVVGELMERMQSEDMKSMAAAPPPRPASKVMPPAPEITRPLAMRDKSPPVRPGDRGLWSFWRTRRADTDGKSDPREDEAAAKRAALTNALPPGVRTRALVDPKDDPLSLDHPQIQILIKPPTERELIETEIIKSLIQSYFNIVKKNIQDSAPKAIMFFLVNFVKKDIQSELVKILYKEQLFEGLLKEADDVAEKRASCMELLDIMQRALDIVNQVRDFNVIA